MLTKFGSVLTFILAVALVALLAVAVYFQHDRTHTEDFIAILPDNGRNIPSDSSKADYHTYELDNHSRKAQHQQNSERNYGLASIPFVQGDNSSELVLIEPRKSPSSKKGPARIGRAKLDLHKALSNGVEFDMWTGKATIEGQPFRLLFDTTSFGLWVPSMDSDVKGKTRFNVNAAPRVKEVLYRVETPKHQLIQDDGEAKPYSGQVVIGDKVGRFTLFWTVKNFKPEFEGLPFDGCVFLMRRKMLLNPFISVLGLGLRHPGTDNPGLSFLDQLCAWGHVDCIFSFYLAITDSQLHLLRTDPKCFKEDTVEHHKALPYLDTHNSLSSWVIGPAVIKTNGVPAVTVTETILDTTTGPILGPPHLVYAFYKKLHEFKLDVDIRKHGGRDLYFFNCGPRAPEFKISFSWGGRDWKWTANQ
jgi:hypothetical protein